MDSLVKAFAPDEEPPPLSEADTLRSYGAELPSSGSDQASAKPNAVLAYLQHREILVPSYVAFVVKSLRNLDASTLTIDLAFTLVVRINFGGLPHELTRELTDSIAFRFNESPMNIDPEHTDTRWKGSLFVMTMRIVLSHVVFTGDNFDYGMWKAFPFDEPRLAFRLEFTSHTIEAGALKGWKVRYNVHGHLGTPAQRPLLSEIERVRPMMSFKTNADGLPAFDCKMEELAVTFTAERKAKDGVTFIYFPVVTFVIPLFRHPGTPLRGMVFPLMVTDMGIVMTHFMSPLKYEERTATLVTVLLALFAFLNFARSLLPDVPVATWLDKQIFRSVAMSLIGMLETLLCKYEYVGYTLLDDNRLQLDGYYPSQWNFAGQPLSGSQTVSRVVRCLLLAIQAILMLLTCGEILFAMRAYQKQLARSSEMALKSSQTEMKKRSTDFDASAFGWPMDSKTAADVAVRATTRPQFKRRSRSYRSQSFSDGEGVGV